MAWSRTTKIGCGVQNCSNETFIVCNYDIDPAYGEQIYFKSDQKPSAANISDKFILFYIVCLYLISE